MSKTSMVSWRDKWEVRVLLISQVIAVTALFINILISNSTNKIAEKMSLIEHDKYLSDEFNNAIKQLTSKTEHERLNGITTIKYIIEKDSSVLKKAVEYLQHFIKTKLNEVESINPIDIRATLEILAECSKKMKIELSFIKFHNINFSGLTFYNTNFSNSDFEGSVFIEFHCIGCNFMKSNLSHTYVGRSTFIKSYMSGVKINCSGFRWATFLQTDLSYSNMRESDMQFNEYLYSDLTGADFSLSNMAQSEFDHSNMKEVIFDKAVLIYSKFYPEKPKEIDLKNHGWEVLVKKRSCDKPSALNWISNSTGE